MSNNIDNSQDIIDIRDVQSRIEKLEAERTDLVEAVDSATETLTDALDDTSALSPEDIEEAQENVSDAVLALEDWDADNATELETLQDLVTEVSEDASPMIRESYFKEYAEQLADDIGAIDSNANWPLSCIDWDKAAEELQQDYSRVDYDGVDYWVRSC